MSISDQNDKAGSYYHGTGAIVSQISKFLQGADKYGNIWVKEDTPDGPMTVMPEYLHRQVDKVLITGQNITPQSLENTYATNAGRVSGRTIRTWAIACICEAKKMLTLVDEAVKEKILQREEDEYEYRSGKNESDFINFLLYRMYHWKVFNGATADEDTHVNAKAASSAKTDTTLEADTSNKIAGEMMEPRELDETCDGSDDEDGEKSASDELENPPYNYLPTGFIYFMTRGPLADKEFRVDILTLHTFLKDGTGARISHRKANEKQKSAERDFDLGQNKAPHQGRGLALGADNQKEVAKMAQNQAKLCNQAYDSEIVKRDMLIKSKSGQVTAVMQLAKMYQDMGNKEKALEKMAEVEDLLVQIKSIETELHNLKSDSAANSVEVDEYLKRGWTAMGIKSASNKKQKSKDKETHPLSVDCDLNV